jgi:hypothetical protein
VVARVGVVLRGSKRWVERMRHVARRRYLDSKDNPLRVVAWCDVVARVGAVLRGGL